MILFLAGPVRILRKSFRQVLSQFIPSVSTSSSIHELKLAFYQQLFKTQKNICVTENDKRK